MSQELEKRMMKRAEGERHNIDQQPMQELRFNNEALKKESTPQQILQNHEITIRFFTKGALIRVGCQAFAFSNNEEAMNELSKYVEDPESQIKKYQQ